MRENSNMNLILELLQPQLFQCHREERRRFSGSSLRARRAKQSLKRRRLPRYARNGGLPRRYAPHNDILKIYIAFILG